MPPIKNPSDRIRIAQLEGRAIRLARDKGSIADAIAELREMAAGRTDLLAEAAGVMGGAWSVKSATETGDYVVAFGLLIMSGADHNRVAEWVEVGRKRAAKPMHGDVTSRPTPTAAPRACLACPATSDSFQRG